MTHSLHPQTPDPSQGFTLGQKNQTAPAFFSGEEIKVGWLYVFTLSLFYFIYLFFLHEGLITKPMMTHDPVFHVFLVM